MVFLGPGLWDSISLFIVTSATDVILSGLKDSSPSSEAAQFSGLQFSSPLNFCRYCAASLFTSEVGSCKYRKKKLFCHQDIN